jgi:hypothetical protein
MALGVTTEVVARDLLASMNTDAGFLNAIKWIDYRYKQLCSRVRFFAFVTYAKSANTKSPLESLLA